MGKNLKTDHWGMAYEDSEWALKTNARSIVKNMPLLREYANYGDRETEAKRWPTMLYSRPIRSGVDYFAINLQDREAAKIDVGEGGFRKHKGCQKLKIMRKPSYGANRTNQSVMSGCSVF